MGFRDAFPIFETLDLERAVAFYTDRFGFEERYRIPGFSVLVLGPLSLGFSESTDVDPPGRAALWLYTDDVDAEIADFRAAGVDVAREPEDQQWGERMGSVLDPDGNEIYLGQRLDR